MSEKPPMHTEADFQRHNFFRSPSWRWNRVLKICDRPVTPGRCSRHDDEFVRRARNFLCRWKDTESSEQRHELWRADPEMTYAYHFHEAESIDPKGAVAIQARLLARQSYDEIAHALSSYPGAIHLYEMLFFEVTPYIDARDWITSQILIPAFERQKPVPQHDEDGKHVLLSRESIVAKPFMDASLKMFAYFGGPKIVDFLLHGIQAGKPLTSLDDLSNWIDSHWSSIVRRRSLQASCEFEVNKYNVMELFVTHTRIMELERSEDSKDQRKT